MKDTRALGRVVERRLSTTFHQPRGTRVPSSGVGGYYIDLRVKATSVDVLTAWPWERGTRPWVGLTQLGLGAYERYLAGEGESWLGLARDVSDELCRLQVSDGPRDGAWEHALDYPHTFSVRAPWVSAMAQGQAASLLVRTFGETGHDRYADSAVRALRLNSVLVEDGGACALLAGAPFPQEYPTQPASHVLNGGIYAMWGWRDVAEGLGEAGARRSYDAAVETLASNVGRWDAGWWSRYDLVDRRPRNLASLAYHGLHVHQLEALGDTDPRPELARALARFSAYQRSLVRRAGALGHKAAFRLRTPRSSHPDRHEPTAGPPSPSPEAA